LNSLERSLQVGMMLSLVVLMFVFWWTGTLTSRLLSESFVYTRLQTEASNLERSLVINQFDAETSIELRDRVDNHYEVPASGHYFVIQLGSNTELMSRSAWDQNLALPALAPGQQRKSRDLGRGEAPLLVWSGAYSRLGQAFTITVAEDITPIESRLRVFQWWFAGIALAMLAVLAAVQHYIVRGSVSQLDAIRQDINRLERGKVTSLSEDVPGEIKPLVREFNRLLIRFDQRLRQSRNAVGNLAHAVKGPMNLLLRAADSVPDQSDSQQKDQHESIQVHVERISTLIDGELKRARLAGRGTVGQRFDIDAELPPLIGLLQQVYSEKNIDVRYSIGPDVQLLHDRQDMFELIGNLLDNAVKWANSVVMVNVRSANGLLFEVEDDGPGCSPAEIDQLTDRGVRLDESISGHGLGLSIVKDIVDTYDGTLELGNSSRLGGFRASVRLPDVVEIKEQT